MTNKIEKNLLDELLIALIAGDFLECVRYYKDIKKNGYSNIDRFIRKYIAIIISGNALKVNTLIGLSGLSESLMGNTT
jgi:hypothetical protein